MIDYINSIPVFTYIRNPSVENAQAAIQFFQNNHQLLSTLARVVKQSFLVLAAGSLITFLLDSREVIREDEKSQMRRPDSDEPTPISTIWLFSKLFFCMTTLSGFSYISCKTGSWFSFHVATWIQSYNN